MQGLEGLGVAYDVSDDGSVMVGGTAGFGAVRWTESTGAVALGPSASVARAVSGDGAIVVGEANDGFVSLEAFIWDDSSGMRALRDVLEGEYGLDLTGWQLDSATGISADGRTIVGGGTDPQGRGQGWIAQIPEPSSAGLAAVGVIGLALLRRARRAS